MIEKLFNKIKYLEKEIENIKEKNEIVAKNLRELFKECKVEKEKKDAFKQELIKNLNALKIDNVDLTFTKGILNFSKFLEFLSDSKDIYVVAIKLTSDEVKNKYIYSYFIKHFNPLFSIYNDILLGVIEKKDLDKVKRLNFIPFFNPKTEEVSDIELFKIVFYVDEINFENINKLIKKFQELSNRPSFKNKHFIEYSLEKDRIVDFEQEEIQKNKEKYAFIYKEKYPDLEIKLKKEINNIPFLLALLERIDMELEEIKNSRGLMNVVNRILKFMEIKTNEKEIRNMVKSLKESLKN